ncbi:MAG: hypothetical protein ACHQJ6_00130 [Candidatus Berkiellales bacterium]
MWQLTQEEISLVSGGMHPRNKALISATVSTVVAGALDIMFTPTRTPIFVCLSSLFWMGVFWYQGMHNWK